MVFRPRAHEEGGERRLRRQHQRLRRRRGRAGGAAAAGRGRDVRRTVRSSGSRAPSGRSPPSWCCSRWVHRPAAARARRPARGRPRRARQRRPRRRYMTSVPRCLRGRRRRARPVADRLGDRRGPGCAAVSTRTSPARRPCPRPIPPTARPLGPDHVRAVVDGRARGRRPQSDPGARSSPAAVEGTQHRLDRLHASPREDRLHPGPATLDRRADPRAGRRRAWTSPGST